MHSSLTEHARCVYGDEFQPDAVPCAANHDPHYFIEALTFADADAILAMLRELSPNQLEGYLPVWVRNLAYRLVVLQRPGEPELMREAALNLWTYGPDWDDIAADLKRQAGILESGGGDHPAEDGGSLQRHKDAHHEQ
ncbi:hypothetical protein [Winogradskya humida]|uniref:Uncharacterized protein n=1 Tax=Winogradskya humida TaxID=113566 RepID=A0ABQ3ZZG4_9ACTN|nr:hypothetical protein [Actinoplanes humidus]GIE23995.1 hypothetical protein Ahu01nite_070970 [Actinoplanes humidus]